MMSRISEIVSRWFYPMFPLAALEFSDSGVYIAKIDGKKMQSASVRLEPGIVKNGKIIDKRHLLKHLHELMKEWSGKADHAEAVHLIIPSSLADLKLGYVTGYGGLKNIESDNRQVYPIGKPHSDGKLSVGLVDYDGKAVLEISGVLERGGFLAVSAEPSYSALARMFRKTGARLSEDSHIVVRILNTGVEVLLLQAGEVSSFERLTWGNYRQSFLKGPIERAMHFYKEHHQGRLRNLILISEVLAEDIKKKLESDFNLPVIIFSPHHFHKIKPDYFAVLGGLIRARNNPSFKKGLDFLKDSENIFSNLNFWLWLRKIRGLLVFSAAFAVLIFALADGFLLALENRYAKKLKDLGSASQEVSAVWRELKQFSYLVNMTGEVSSLSKTDVSAVLNKINDAAKNKIEISEINLDFSELKGTISGKSKTETAILGFRDSLLAKGLEELVLPLAGIKPISGGSGFSFSINFQIF